MSKEAEKMLDRYIIDEHDWIYQKKEVVSKLMQAYADEQNKERDIKLIKFIYEETCQLRETNSEPTDMNVFAKSMLKHFQTLNK